MNIRCGNCQGRHETIAEVKRCCGVLIQEGAPTYPLATDPQANFIRSLLDDREIPPHLGEWAANIRRALGNGPDQPRTIGKRDASQTITILSNKENFPVKPRPAVQAGVAAYVDANWPDDVPLPGIKDYQPVSVRPTCDGMYRNPDTGEIFKLQWNRASGDGRRLYAKQLIVHKPRGAYEADDEITSIPLRGTERSDESIGYWVEFRYAAGAIARVRPEWLMSMEEARQFGALYGTCVRCGRTLTAEDSIERMMGPVCAGKGNWA